MPSDEAALSTNLGGDLHHAVQRSRGSAAGSWQGPPRRKGASRGSGSTGAYAPLVRSIAGSPQAVPEEVAQAYPGARIWRQDQGFWLLTESRLLPGEYRHARFATAVCLKSETCRSWAFWVSELSEPVAIGPRHTYLDGAICAFENSDEVWSFGDPLEQLLDIYTLWAFRHLHLERLGRWAGPQVARDYFERIVECRPEELCGCDNPKGRYRDCCFPRDTMRDHVEAWMMYRSFYGPRQPPSSVVDFASRQGDPPSVRELLPMRASDLDRVLWGIPRRSRGVPLPIRMSRSR